MLAEKENISQEEVVVEDVVEEEEEPVEEVPPPKANTVIPAPPVEVKIPFPQRVQKKKLDDQFSRFLDIFRKVHIIIPLVEALQQMSSYAKFLKDVISKKRRWVEHETVNLTESCSAIIQKKLPAKMKDPRSFTISCIVGDSQVGKALCDLGASINLMTFSFFQKLKIGTLRPTTITLQMADRSVSYPRGIVEDILVTINDFIFPMYFVVLDMEEDRNVPLILGRPFLATGKAMIDVQKGELTLRLNDESVTFSIYNAMQRHDDEDAWRVEHCNMVEVVDDCALNSTEEVPRFRQKFLPLRDPNEEEKKEEKKEELKPLPSHLKYAFLGENATYPVIVSSSLTTNELDKLLRVLRKHRGAIGWSISDLKGISPTEDVIWPLQCPNHLSKVYDRYEETHLVLNWQKCHFMVRDGIVLGHKISAGGLEVDRAKIVAIEKFLPPSNEKAMRSFLGHAGFYRRFIKDFSRIARPLCHLLAKDVKFDFSPECLQAFETLKKTLVSAPVLTSPDWSQPFEIMCDASDVVVGSALGQETRFSG
ncbi:uncharacterized protein LOC125189658 [Salvia hispanica]|uniref:uncharacterized protein LOC125189658 n=1 Tax=Salvia hispanica TaxID=49212 RepID=UPI0020099915|nr:uncharacterized protein LOC125189658 [Salvia hispanica]